MKRLKNCLQCGKPVKYDEVVVVTCIEWLCESCGFWMDHFPKREHLSCYGWRNIDETFTEIPIGTLFIAKDVEL